MRFDSVYENEGIRKSRTSFLHSSGGRMTKPKVLSQQGLADVQGPLGTGDVSLSLDWAGPTRLSDCAFSQQARFHWFTSFLHCPGSSTTPKDWMPGFQDAPSAGARHPIGIQTFQHTSAVVRGHNCGSWARALTDTCPSDRGWRVTKVLFYNLHPNRETLLCNHQAKLYNDLQHLAKAPGILP